MKYFLIKIPYKSGKPENITSFESEFSACELCKADKFGFLIAFKKNHFIGLINNKNEMISPWLGFPDKAGDKNSSGINARICYPSSLCYSKKTNSCYLVHNGGTRLKKINLHMTYPSDVFGTVLCSKMDKYISKVKKIEDINTKCCVDEKEVIYWSIDNLHRCFKYKNCDVDEVAGNGRPNHFVSNASNNPLNFPSGVVYDNDSVYICDTNNHCIKSFSDKMLIVAGDPLKCGDEDGNDALLISPYCIRKSRRSLYFLDNGKIKYFSLGNKAVGTIYSSNNIVSIDADDNNIYILEVK